MFCPPNEVQETLFSPLPPSLWTDYYNDRDPNEYGKKMRPQSSQGGLLPSPCHFRSLTPTSSDEYFGEGIRRDPYGVVSPTHKNNNDNDSDAFHDEFVYSNGSPNARSFSTHSGGNVKSLFNDGCLFAYKTPSDVRTRIRRSLSPRSRRCKNTDQSSQSSQSSQEDSSRRKFRRNRHRFRL
jgi:hypothetical protein